MKRALVLSLICVIGLAFSGLAATLSGSWDTDVSIDPQQTSFDLAIGLVSVLTVTYTVGDWSFTSVTDLDDGGWTDQDFSVAGVLGAFSLSSALDFVPAPTPAFGSWKTSAAVSIAGVSFGADFTLLTDDVALDITAGGVAGDVTFGVTVSFGDIFYTPVVAAVAAVAGNPAAIAWIDGLGNLHPAIAAVQTVSAVAASGGVRVANGCDLDWAGITIDIGFPFCCADIDLAVEFDCDGFVDACFSVVGIGVPNMPYLSLDAELCFTMDEKTLVLTPVFDFGVIACFDLYFNAVTDGNLMIQNISIEGIGLTCTISGVDFTGLSYWGTGAKPGLLKGTDYWEVYGISTADDGCCGPFGFDLAFYFLQGGGLLFDISLIDANMTLEVAAQFAFEMGLEMDLEAGGFTNWTVGFVVTW